MRITQWGEYGLHFSTFVASKTAQGQVIGAQEIATAQGVALDYAQQILQRLRKGGILESVRGPQGGYRLTKTPTEITVRDILIAAEGDTFEIICETKPLDNVRCHEGTVCALRGLWRDLKTHVDQFLSDRTLADLVAIENSPETPVQIARHTADAA